MKSFFLSAFLILTPFFAHSGFGEEAGNRGDRNEGVILLHGLGRTQRSMATMETRLRQEGYWTVNYGYPSTRHDIQELARTHVPRAVERCRKQSVKKIHFVTHSLGGILVRQYLQNNTIANCGRVVMLSPPNQGSELAERLKKLFLYRTITGPAGQQLGTGEDSIPNKLKPIDAEVGVITGNRSLEPWFSIGIPGEDDGKVSVERARLAEMTDFLVVKSCHALIMQHSEVIDQVVFYLKNGHFRDPN